MNFQTKSMIKLFTFQVVFTILAITPFHLANAAFITSSGAIVQKINSYLYEGQEINIAEEFGKEIDQDRFRKFTVRAQAISADSVLNVKVNDKVIKSVKLSDELKDIDVEVKEEKIKSVKIGANAAFIRMAKVDNKLN